MDQKIPLLFIVSCLMVFGSCKSVNEEAIIDLDGQSSIHLINNTDDSVKIHIRYFTTWPYKDNRIRKTIAPHRELIQKLINQGKNHYNLTVGNSTYNLFCQYSSIDSITISQSEKGKIEIGFGGHLKEINEFLERKTNHFNSLMSERIGRTESMFEKKNSFNRLVAINDSITVINSDFIIANDSDIPKWYRNFELKRLKYLNAWYKINAVFYRKLALNLPDPIPDNFFDNTIAQLKIQDTTMLGNLDYMLFLDYIVTYKIEFPFNKKRTESSENEELFKERIELINYEFSGLTKDALLTNELCGFIESGSIFDSTWFELVKHEHLRMFLKDYYNSHSVALKKGDEVPYFYLPDINNKYYEPSLFENRIVLINFWSPGCVPCILDFPEENKLVEKYRNEPVSIVNICTVTSSEEVWRSTVSKHKLKTVNLIAKGKWKEKINKNFDIRSLPHSVLIDWNGKIVQNKCSRPSQNIDKQIEELLIEMRIEGNRL